MLQCVQERVCSKKPGHVHDGTDCILRGGKDDVAQFAAVMKC